MNSTRMKHSAAAWDDPFAFDEAAYADDNIAAPEPEPPAGDPPAICFCGEPLNQNTWCGCAEGLRRLKADQCDQGDDEIGAERQWSREARPDDQDFGCSDADLGQLTETQEWATTQTLAL